MGDVKTLLWTHLLLVDVRDEDEGEKHGDLKALLNDSKEVQVENTSSDNRRYPERTHKPRGEWWKIFPRSDDEHANVALSDGTLTIREAIEGEDVVKR